MSAVAFTRSRFAPALLGFGTLVARHFLDAGADRFRGFLTGSSYHRRPKFPAFERVILEEQIVDRFFLTLKECVFAALLLAVFGISIGTLLYKVSFFVAPPKPGSPRPRPRQPC